MKNFILISLVFLCACSAKNFAYDRQNACVINYGFNSISVIIDGDKKLIRNNRMTSASNLVTIRTNSGNFKTFGRYFSDEKSDAIITALKESDKIYMEWITSENASSGPKIIHRATIDVSDFNSKYDECTKQQKSRS